MTDILIQAAEEDFLEKKRFSAYEVASLAKQLDPFYGGIDNHLQVYRIQVAALSRPHGEIDWYGILDVKDKSASTKTITHAFVRLAKLIDPQLHRSAAAPEAYKLIVKAFEILENPESRRAYHARRSLPPPSSHISIPSKKSCAGRKRKRL